jgi:cytochrome c biogenesis protein CcmG/thiol:disulfide interchange protein DsbE
MSSTEQTPIQPNKRFPWLIAGVSAVILIGLLVVLGMWIKRSAVKTLEIGADIPDFSITSFDGETFQKSKLAGKLILVNFWSSWCSSCDEEGDALEEVWQEVKSSGDIVFIGINYVDTERDSRAFIEKYGFTYANGADLGSRISHIFKVQAVPETYIIGRDGKLAAMKIGPFASADEIRQLLETAEQRQEE